MITVWDLNGRENCNLCRYSIGMVGCRRFCGSNVSLLVDDGWVLKVLDDDPRWKLGCAF
jgi:hypothetical protein